MRCVLAGIFVLSIRADGGCAGMGWSVLAAWLRRMMVVGLSRCSTDRSMLVEVDGDCCRRLVHRIHEDMFWDGTFSHGTH